MPWFATFLDQYPSWVRPVVAAFAAFAIGYVLGEAAARAVRWGFLALSGGPDRVDFRSPIVRRPVRVVRLAVTLCGTALLLAPMLRIAGMDVSIGLNPHALGNWLLGVGVRVATVALLAFLTVRIVILAVGRLELRLTGGECSDPVERAKRARTICALLRQGLNVAVLGAALLMILRELGMDIAPILAGAGVVGLAVGFGAQSLVRDVISGFFMILEDQVRVGDVAVIDGTGGLVESIQLRTTVLRDLSGVVHVFPNGSIQRLSNMTKDFSYAVLDVGVAYKEDTDHVVDVLRTVGADLAADDAFAPLVLEPLEVLGVDAFGDSQVTIKVRMKTRPIQQWAVGRELRRRIKKAFDATGIEIPFPHVSVYVGEASRPWQVQALAPQAPDS